jgi:hypothetical protein
MISKLKLTLSLLNICTTHYKMVSNVVNGTERVNRIKNFKVILDSKGLKYKWQHFYTAFIPWFCVLQNWPTWFKRPRWNI